MVLFAKQIHIVLFVQLNKTGRLGEGKQMNRFVEVGGGPAEQDMMSVSFPPPPSESSTYVPAPLSSLPFSEHT